MENQYEPFDLEAQEEVKKADELKAKIAATSEGDDFKWLMSSRRGRRVVWRLMELTGVFRSSFDPTAMRMAYNEGFRNFGLRMLSIIQSYCPELYNTMTLENTQNGKPDQPK